MIHHKTMRKKLMLLRTAGIAEGISLLILLLVAMPLKYFFNQPLPVTVIGWIHGILFLAFVSLAWDVKTDLNKSMKWLGIAFLAALIPTGTFFFDRKLKEELAK